MVQSSPCQQADEPGPSADVISSEFQRIPEPNPNERLAKSVSTDLAVWSTRAFNFPAELPQSSLWKSYDDEFAFEKDDWQVSILSEQTEPDPSVVHKLSGANFVAWISLEPIGAEPDGYAFLEEVVRSVTRKVGGVWVDQNGLVYFHDEGNF